MNKNELKQALSTLKEMVMEIESKLLDSSVLEVPYEEVLEYYNTNDTGANEDL